MTQRRKPAVIVGLVVLVCLLAAPSPPRSWADRGENVFSGVMGLSGFRRDQVSLVGGSLGMDYERGVTESTWLRTSVGGGFYPGSGGAYSLHATLGLTHALDVLRYVPYVNLGLGGIAVDGADIGRAIVPLAELGLGLDALVSRSLSYGIVARLEYFFDETAFYFVALRVSHRWGFF